MEQNKRQRTSRAQWLFPRKDNLHAAARLNFGFIGNAALLSYVVPRRDHLFDIRDYRYVPLDLACAFVLAAAPAVVLLGLLPVLRSDRAIHRWLGIAFSIFPALLAIVEWLQLLML